MNRKTILAVALTFGMAAACPASAQTAAAPKIGVIDVQRVVTESAVGKESVARVQKLQASKQDDLAKRQKELRELEQRIQEQGKSLSEEAMEKLQKDYQGKAVEMKRFQDDAQRELEETQRKELKQLEERIMPVIDTVAKDQGFSVIFNKYQSGLLFADASTDLTEAVITKFNTQITSAPKTDKAPAKPAAAPAAKAPASAAKAPAPAATPAPKK